MENMVIPNIENVYKKERARDELPQSGSGRTIMTAEPKFVPEEAAEIEIDGGVCNVRLVDCVGYMVEGALGDMEGDSPRMVSTPWSESEMTMKQASEIGTRKVITEHSTIGLVITTDGTVTDIDGNSYIPAEDKVISELLEIGKPFVTLINTSNPTGEQAKTVKKRIYDKYGIEAMCINCMTLEENDIHEIIKSVLYEFPISEIRIDTPSWLNSLPNDSELKTYIYCNILQSAKLCACMKDIKFLCSNVNLINNISSCNVNAQDLATGVSSLSITIPSEVFYEIIKKETGFKISSEADLIPMLTRFASIEKEYMRMNGALEQVRQTGYGIVMPSIDELTLNRPEIVKQSGKYGVKLTAKAPSVHLIRADIETEVSPIVGSANTLYMIDLIFVKFIFCFLPSICEKEIFQHHKEAMTHFFVVS